MLIGVWPDEFGDAVAHYDDKQAGLGQRFRDEVDQHIRWIMGHADVPRRRLQASQFKVFSHSVYFTKTACPGPTVCLDLPGKITSALIPSGRVSSSSNCFPCVQET